MNWAKLAVPSHSEPLWWEKIGKVLNQAELAVLSDSEPLRWEKMTFRCVHIRWYPECRTQVLTGVCME